MGPSSVPWRFGFSKVVLLQIIAEEGTTEQSCGDLGKSCHGIRPVRKTRLALSMHSSVSNRLEMA